MAKQEMIQVTKEEWNKIPKDYKGEWTANFQKFVPDIPDAFIGKRNVMAGCVKKDGGTTLLTEGFHFEIID